MCVGFSGSTVLQDETQFWVGYLNPSPNYLMTLPKTLFGDPGVSAPGNDWVNNSPVWASIAVFKPLFKHQMTSDSPWNRVLSRLVSEAERLLPDRFERSAGAVYKQEREPPPTAATSSPPGWGVDELWWWWWWWWCLIEQGHFTTDKSNQLNTNCFHSFQQQQQQQHKD